MSDEKNVLTQDNSKERRKYRPTKHQMAYKPVRNFKKRCYAR